MKSEIVIQMRAKKLLFLDSIVGSKFIETNKTDTDEDYGNGIVENTMNKLESSDLSEVDKLYEEWKSEGSGDFEGSGKAYSQPKKDTATYNISPM